MVVSALLSAIACTWHIECNHIVNLPTLLFSTNRQKRRFLLPYECCMFCSLYFGKWQSKRYTYTQNTCPLETEEQKDWPLSWNTKSCLILFGIQYLTKKNMLHIHYTLSYRLLINYHSVENESRSLIDMLKKCRILNSLSLAHKKGVTERIWILAS